MAVTANVKAQILPYMTEKQQGNLILPTALWAARVEVTGDATGGQATLEIRVDRPGSYAHDYEEAVMYESASVPSTIDFTFLADTNVPGLAQNLSVKLVGAGVSGAAGHLTRIAADEQYGHAVLPLKVLHNQSLANNVVLLKAIKGTQVNGTTYQLWAWGFLWEWGLLAQGKVAIRPSL